MKTSAISVHENNYADLMALPLNSLPKFKCQFPFPFYNLNGNFPTLKMKRCTIISFISFIRRNSNSQNIEIRQTTNMIGMQSKQIVVQIILASTRDRERRGVARPNIMIVIFRTHREAITHITVHRCE